MRSTRGSTVSAVFAVLDGSTHVSTFLRKICAGHQNGTANGSAEGKGKGAGDAALAHLQTFSRLIDTYFHPSNSGSYAVHLMMSFPFSLVNYTDALFVCLFLCFWGFLPV